MREALAFAVRENVRQLDVPAHGRRRARRVRFGVDGPADDAGVGGAGQAAGARPWTPCSTPARTSSTARWRSSRARAWACSSSLVAAVATRQRARAAAVFIWRLLFAHGGNL